MELYYDEMESPVGPLLLISKKEKVVRIDYGTYKEKAEVIAKWASLYFSDVTFVRSTETLGHVKNQIKRYFNQEAKSFTIEMELNGTAFQKQVWQALYEQVPYGQTKTYKDLANLIGNPKAVRAVGGAVGKNPFSILIPCHRVIGTDGKMVGYNGGLDKKQFLLNHEGIL